MIWKVRPPRQVAPLSSRARLPSGLGGQIASGGVFSNTPLLSAVYYYITETPSPRRVFPIDVQYLLYIHLIIIWLSIITYKVYHGILNHVILVACLWESGASQSQSYFRCKEKLFRSLIKRGDRKQMLDVSSLRRELTRLLMTIIWTNYLLCDQPYKH